LPFQRTEISDNAFRDPAESIELLRIVIRAQAKDLRAL
jgi:hypothetical protein